MTLIPQRINEYLQKITEQRAAPAAAGADASQKTSSTIMQLINTYSIIGIVAAVIIGCIIVGQIMFHTSSQHRAALRAAQLQAEESRATPSNK